MAQFGRSFSGTAAAVLPNDALVEMVLPIAAKVWLTRQPLRPWDWQTVARNSLDRRKLIGVVVQMFKCEVEAHPMHTFEYLTMRCIDHNWFATSPTNWDLLGHTFTANDFIDLGSQSPYRHLALR